MIRKDIEIRTFTTHDGDDLDAYDKTIMQVRLFEKMHTGAAGHVFEMTVAEADELAGKLQAALRRVSGGHRVSQDHDE